MRKIKEIAKDIIMAWPKVNFAAQPYLQAMLQLETIKDKYIAEDATSIILYFLANASGFRGTKAKELKNELQAIMKAGNYND